MKRKLILLVIMFACSIIFFSNRAQAAIFWDWNFTNNFQTFGSTDSIIAKGRITNLATSDSNLTFQNFGTASYGNAPAVPYQFAWGDSGQFFLQFFGLDLAPGQSFDFVFGNLTPYGITPPGFYFFIAGFQLEGVEPDSSIRRDFYFKVNGLVSPTPEPSALFLVSFGLFGLFLNRKRTRLA
ncbi:MAG: PEP-CTERM sorting domain-containing protein [Candidatus Omnitrophica bacterium]|nr:PEP-CTERM sorting domain-containing protein [Candidatus Omnitrophota bacterium]